MSVIVIPPGESVFSANATVISIEDEAAGEYLTIKQQNDDTPSDEGNQRIIITPEEWPEIKQALEMMLKEIEKNEKNDL